MDVVDVLFSLSASRHPSRASAGCQLLAGGEQDGDAGNGAKSQPVLETLPELPEMQDNDRNHLGIPDSCTNHELPVISFYGRRPKSQIAMASVDLPHHAGQQAHSV